MNYIEKLTELKDKITPEEWGFYPKEEIDDLVAGAQTLVVVDGSDNKPVAIMAGGKPRLYDAEFISTMRNSLDLWLELASAAEEMYVGVMTENWPVSSQMKMRDALKNLKGEG